MRKPPAENPAVPRTPYSEGGILEERGRSSLASPVVSFSPFVLIPDAPSATDRSPVESWTALTYLDQWESKE
jgi:hypothetical protein